MPRAAQGWEPISISLSQCRDPVWLGAVQTLCVLPHYRSLPFFLVLGPCNFWKTDASTRWFGHCIIHKCSPLGQILLNLSIFWIISEQWESAWHVTEPDCVPLFCRLEVLSEKRQLSYPVSMEDIALLNSESYAFISWCETQDEFLNVSVAFNIWEPYLMSPLDFSKSTSRGLWKGELLITRGKGEAGSLESEGVVLWKALN